MATRFDDWEGDFLAHHGIKGQKWGVRRFQNPDGTLTELGRKRVAQSGTYMEPDLRRAIKRIGKIPNRERDRVYQKFQKEYWDNFDDMYDAPHSTSDKYKKLWDSMKGKYASATLKDLGYKDNSAARKQVRAILKEISADWDNPDPEWSEYVKAKERRKELMHPKRTKAKKTVKNTAEVVGTIRKITG